VTVPVQISWDLYLGKVVVWCECVRAGVRRAVLLPRLDTVFTPVEEHPGREVAYEELDWRLVSPTERDWDRYRELVEKQASRYGLSWWMQRVERIAEWVGGRRVAVPHYHIWLYRDAEVGEMIERLYLTLDPEERRGLWRWLLAWTAPAVTEPQDLR
jgi:hypothetical protein